MDNLIEELYQVIQKNRVNKPRRLFKEPAPRPNIRKNYKSLISICCVTLGIIVGSFLLSYIMLENKVKTIQFGHQIIASLDE